MRVAIFGSEATHEARGVQTALVMSRTSRPAPFSGTSTATAPGMFGIGDVGVGAGVAATVGAAVRAGAAVGGGGAATGGAQAVIASSAGSAKRTALNIERPSHIGGIL